MKNEFYSFEGTIDYNKLARCPEKQLGDEF